MMINKYKYSRNRQHNCIFLLLTVFFQLFATVSFSDEYSIGAGDKINIQVFGEPDLSIETLVGDSGAVSYPFLGQVEVKGKSVLQIEDDITQRLKGDYLVDPEVTVSILTYRQFYVNGHVKRPGGYPFQPRMTVRKAISLAGGFEVRANKGKLRVVHSDDPDAKAISIELDAIVRPGDIIIVERSFF
jgi:polysaccharide export outer membrane protein